VSSAASGGSPVSQGLEVSSVTATTDAVGYYHVTGRIVDHAAKNATGVKVIVTFYDAKGNVTGAAFTYPTPAEIRAGASAPFDAIIDTKVAPGIATYRVDVETQLFT
jgi:hypothetical protein